MMLLTFEVAAVTARSRVAALPEAANFMNPRTNGEGKNFLTWPRDNPVCPQ